MLDIEDIDAGLSQERDSSPTKSPMIRKDDDVDLLLRKVD
jgi:hypothetical protein